MTPLPAWIEVPVAILDALSGLILMVSSIAYQRRPGFVMRWHPPALAYTFATWCVAIAAALYFSVLENRAVLHPLLVPVLLAITVPVTTVLLMRTALFRKRLAKHDGVPPPLAPLPEDAAGED